MYSKQSLSVSYYNKPLMNFNCCFSFGFLQVSFHLLPIRATCPSHLILLGSITAIADIFIIQLLRHPVLLPPPSLAQESLLAPWSNIFLFLPKLRSLKFLFSALELRCVLLLLGKDWQA